MAIFKDKKGAGAAVSDGNNSADMPENTEASEKANAQSAGQTENAGVQNGAESAETANAKGSAKSAKKAKAQSGVSPAENFSEYRSPYDVGKRPKDRKELLKWYKSVGNARKALRKDLKSRGIKSWGEFEKIAWEMGLTYHEKQSPVLFFWNILGKLKNSLGFKLIPIGASLGLGAVFFTSVMTENAGSFTVNLTQDMLNSGFILSEDINFLKPSSRLFSEETKDISNITIGDIPKDVDSVDGPHNGAHYVAYTFYIMNCGDEPNTYTYAVQDVDHTLGVDKAVWMMLFEDGHQVIYAAESDDGDPEGLIGYSKEPPFYSTAYDPDLQYFKQGSVWGIKTTEYASETVVAQGIVKDVQPGEIHKYTLVIWLEGNDPNCTDEIFGGSAKYEIVFELVDGDSNSSIFSGIFRTEYDDYMEGLMSYEDYMNPEDKEESSETRETLGAGVHVWEGEGDGESSDSETENGE